MSDRNDENTEGFFGTFKIEPLPGCFKFAPKPDITALEAAHCSAIIAVMLSRSGWGTDPRPYMKENGIERHFEE